MPPAPEGATVVIESPPNLATFRGDLVDGKMPVLLRFRIEGAEVGQEGQVESGKVLAHLVINSPGRPAGEELGTDETHIPIPPGETERIVRLGTGRYALTVQLVDGLRRSYGPELSATTIVQIPAPPSVLETMGQQEQDSPAGEAAPAADAP
jgi:hypothetical protein